MSNERINDTPVTRSLDKMKIPYRYFAHPGQIKSLEQAAHERGQRPQQIIRSILFRLSGDEYVMVLVSGPHQISWPDLRTYLGVSRITMANKDQVLEHTGYPSGAVSPFGLPEPIRLLVDEQVFNEDEISIGSGVRNSTVIMQSTDLHKALRLVHGDLEIACFVEC
jgi:Cys-tRNA(Pro) deacylase